MGQNQVSFIERCPYVLVWGRTKCPLWRGVLYSEVSLYYHIIDLCDIKDYSCFIPAVVCDAVVMVIMLLLMVPVPGALLPVIFHIQVLTLVSKPPKLASVKRLSK